MLGRISPRVRFKSVDRATLNIDFEQPNSPSQEDLISTLLPSDQYLVFLNGAYYTFQHC